MIHSWEGDLFQTSSAHCVNGVLYNAQADIEVLLSALSGSQAHHLHPPPPHHQLTSRWPEQPVALQWTLVQNVSKFTATECLSDNDLGRATGPCSGHE